jgi:hypothetical protein
MQSVLALRAHCIVRQPFGQSRACPRAELAIRRGTQGPEKAVDFEEPVAAALAEMRAATTSSAMAGMTVRTPHGTTYPGLCLVGLVRLRALRVTRRGNWPTTSIGLAWRWDVAPKPIPLVTGLRCGESPHPWAQAGSSCNWIRAVCA